MTAIGCQFDKLLQKTEINNQIQLPPNHLNYQGEATRLKLAKVQVTRGPNTSSLTRGYSFEFEVSNMFELSSIRVWAAATPIKTSFYLRFLLVFTRGIQDQTKNIVGYI